MKIKSRLRSAISSRVTVCKKDKYSNKLTVADISY